MPQPLLYPRRESNPNLKNRNLPFYPLNYEGIDDMYLYSANIRILTDSVLMVKYNLLSLP